MGAKHPTVERFEKVQYGLSAWSDSTPDSAWEDAKRRGVMQAIAVLEGAVHEISATQPVVPAVEVSGLHPWVAGAISGLWNDGHHRQAVDEATRAIEVRLRTKLGKDLSGYSLVTEAFNPAPPKSGQRRLRFPGFAEGSQAWTDAHQGAMHFAQGCMLRIRNLVEHHEGEIDRQVALESIAALSLLARWTNEATVANGEPDT